MSTTNTLRALRFVNFRFDGLQAKPGLGIGASGGLQLVADDAAIRQSLMLLLSTRPGERVMRPDYGCNLYRLVFATNDETTAGLAIHYVRRAVSRFEPRLELLEVDADPHPERTGQLELHLAYRMRRTLQRGQLAFSINLLPSDLS